MFIDRVSLTLSAGNGGNGAIAWRREKFIPKGGPAGGDGGNGGSITLEANPEALSLEDLRNRRIIKAQNGNMGGGNNCKGKNGRDLVISVPLGTLVKDTATQKILYDFTQKSDRWKICAGGKGGKGNTRFKSPTNQAPLIFTEGTPGECAEVELELKLIADVGFVGMPNAGKSTLISRLANIAVKIAPYPFTTLRPNLGLMILDDFSRLLIADIPGIIENAHQNRGLGLSFLRHVERCAILIFIIELSPWEETRDPYKEFCMLRKEIEAYNPALLEKPFLVALNKIDLDGASALARQFREQYSLEPQTLFDISAQNGAGCDDLKKTIQMLAQQCVKKLG
jgi:GTP-binding protein